MSDLSQFLQLFTPRPGNHYLQVTTSVDETTKALDDMMKSVDGELHLAIYNEEKLVLSDLYPDAKIQQTSNLKHPFRALPRNSDIVVLKDILDIHENPKLLLKTTYTTLANAAYVIVMQKKGTMDIWAMKELLEEHEFRSPNEIDVLPEYDLIMAKKMHMWGNGL